MRVLVVLAAIAASPALGQAACTVNGLPCPGAYATQADIAAAALPDCPTAAPDTLLGSPGTGSRCARRADSTRPTPVQAINTTLVADCTWSIVFGRATTSATPIVLGSVILPANSTQPISCSLTSRSTTAATGKCFPAQTSTLAAVTVAGVSVAVGSQVVNPTATTCTAGMPVMVTVREPTQ